MKNLTQLSWISPLTKLFSARKTKEIISKGLKYRFENFGGIISSQTPPFLAFVDRNYMRELGLKDSKLWNTKDESIEILSAPTEVHFSITNKCSVKCSHCYMDGGETPKDELNFDSILKVLDILSNLNVFHIALGGGEALENPDLFKIAKYAKKKGLVPNLTTSGYNLTFAIAKKMKIFGQVNVSIDGLYENYGIYRKKNIFNQADNAIDFLIKAGVSTGINCVIGKKNFDEIENIFKYAKDKKINEIEFLRLKPSGRGKDLYKKNKTTYEQNKEIILLLAKYSKKYNITAKIDCSFIPMFCYHKPLVEDLYKMAAYGCEAGNVLWGIRSNGLICGCSFLEDSDLSIFDVKKPYDAKTYFSDFLLWEKNAKMPCAKCDYLKICKGGCHGVAKFITNNYNNPDPECPSVVEYNQEKNQE